MVAGTLRFPPLLGNEPMKTFILRFFTWWNGATLGTQLWTWRHGELVGEDELGNCYYRTKGGKIDPALGFERRWVIYNGIVEASTVPPVLARLAASHLRSAADRGKGNAAPVVEAASAQSHRHPRCASSDRVDAGSGPQAEGDRRLQGLDAKPMTEDG